MFILLTFTRLLRITYINDYINHVARVVLLMAVERSQSVKCFLCKDENQSSNPQYHTQVSMVGMPVIPAPEGRSRGF